MYQAELDVVKSIEEKFCENISLPADELEIKRFSKAFSEVFHMDIPQAYLAFLKLCNGFEFNGCIIYSCQNMIENQHDYDFITDNYIVFAEYDIGWFCLEKSNGKYCELDRPSRERVRIFDTLEEMIKYVLRLSVRIQSSFRNRTAFHLPKRQLRVCANKDNADKSQFIDEQIASSKKILLSNDPYKGYYFDDGSKRFYQREIDYLTSQGYTFEATDDGLWQAVKKQW